jgi:hypothetical protein
MESLELEIAEWRSYVERGPAVDAHDVEELEAHLRDQISDLHAVGLDDDEAFLVAVKRMGKVDDLSHEFAREHSGRLWKQLVLSGDDEERADNGWLEALLFAVGAATTTVIACLLAGFPDDGPSWLFRNASLFVLPSVAAWFARRRSLPRRGWLAGAAAFAATAVLVNVFPYDHESTTEVLVAAHLPVALWAVVAYAYLGGEVRSHERRMDFVRFTGEWCIYYVLIALGGGVLMGLTGAILEPTSIDPETVIPWVLSTGAAGAVVVAAWLVESKQRVVENMAPVLTMLFTPLFAVMLTVATVVYAATGLSSGFDRELLGVFDALMVVVLGLVLYGLSAREGSSEPGWMDRIQLVAVLAALTLDVMVLGSMAARIGDLGFTANRAAALGLNLVLLVNLAVGAWLSVRFLTGRSSLHRLERWQTTYLPVFAIWAAAVVVILPPAFGFA